MAWYNSDGLVVRFGTDEVTTAVAGEYETDGPQRLFEITVANMAVVPVNGAIYTYGGRLPAGARIEKVELITTTAVTSSGSGVFNVGLIRSDTTTELDYDGLIAALPVASFNAAGETTVLTAGSTYAGALIGTSLAYNGYISIDYTTADFTAGACKIRVYWSTP